MRIEHKHTDLRMFGKIAYITREERRWINGGSEGEEIIKLSRNILTFLLKKSKHNFSLTLKDRSMKEDGNG